MNDYSFSKPILIEPGVKYFLSKTLQHCHDFKEKYYNHILNIGLFLLFVFLLGSLLLYKYKGKLTPSEKLQKNREKQQYILSKIKNYQDSKRRAQQELISGLPEWGSDLDNNIMNRRY